MEQTPNSSESKENLVHCHRDKCNNTFSEEDAAEYKKAVDNEWDTPPEDIQWETISFCSEDCLNKWLTEKSGFDAPSKTQTGCIINTPGNKSLYKSLEQFDTHTVTVEKDGQIVAESELEYSPKPFPLYYISSFRVISPTEHNKGYGSELIENINTFIRQENIPAFLMNWISNSSREAYDIHTQEPFEKRGLYKRHGWKYINNSKEWMSYNTEGLSDDDIAPAILALRNIK